MWVCKNCKHENKESDEQCQKCYNERTYPHEVLKFFIVTFVLSGMIIPAVVLLVLYEHPLLLSIGCIYFLMAAYFVENCKPKFNAVLSIVFSLFFGVISGIVANDCISHLNITLITITLSVVAFFSTAVFIIYALNEEDEKNYVLETKEEESRKVVEQQRKKEEQRKRAEIKKYGHPTRTISGCGSNGVYSPEIRIFEKSGIIEIGGRKHKFEDILNYGVHEDVTTDLHMSKPSMYGRGLVGGLLYGRVGALVGILTAKQYEEISVVYTVTIWFRNGSQRHIRTTDTYYLDELCAELESIIDLA